MKGPRWRLLVSWLRAHVLMRRALHIVSFIAAIFFFVAIPVGMVAEAHNIVVMPDKWELASFFYFWVFVALYYRTAPEGTAEL